MARLSELGWRSGLEQRGFTCREGARDAARAECRAGSWAALHARGSSPLRHRRGSESRWRGSLSRDGEADSLTCSREIASLRPAPRISRERILDKPTACRAPTIAASRFHADSSRERSGPARGRCCLGLPQRSTRANARGSESRAGAEARPYKSGVFPGGRHLCEKYRLVDASEEFSKPVDPAASRSTPE
jgi:hypothetical protein